LLETPSLFGRLSNPSSMPNDVKARIMNRPNEPIAAVLVVFLILGSASVSSCRAAPCRVIE